MELPTASNRKFETEELIPSKIRSKDIKFVTVVRLTRANICVSNVSFASASVRKSPTHCSHKAW